MTLNVLYTNYHDGYGGGHTTYLMALAKNPHVNSHIACPKSSDLYQFLTAEGFTNLVAVNFARKPKQLGLFFNSAIKLARYIEQHEIDIIHANGDADNRTVLLAQKIAKRAVKYVFTKHNSHPIKGWLAKKRFNQHDAVILVAQSILSSLQLKPINTPCHVIENGIDTAYWHNTTPALPQDGRHLRTDKITLTSTAGTMHYKGWHNLINALKILPDELRARFIVTLIGKEIPEERKQRWCDHDYLPQQVHFIPFKRDTRPYLAHSDIGFVLSHEVETISFACREMMAMGLPMIVSDYAGLPDNIDDNINGWLTKTNDVDSIAQCLIKLSQLTQQQLNDHKHTAREKALKSFDINIMQAKTTDVYYSLIK